MVMNSNIKGIRKNIFMVMKTAELQKFNDTFHNTANMKMLYSLSS
jgi:hypothetical protein